MINSPHFDGAFDMDGAADRNGFAKPTAHPFYLSDFPAYTHVKTKEDGSSAVGADDNCVTCVFQLKRRSIES